MKPEGVIIATEFFIDLESLIQENIFVKVPLIQIKKIFKNKENIHGERTF